MRIGFVDPSSLSYNADTPYSRPLAGSQSAMAYLAAEIAALGHSVSLITNTDQPGIHRGVECVRHAPDVWTQHYLGGFDILVVLNVLAAGQWRRQLGLRVPMVLWCSNTVEFSSGLVGLESAVERKAWNGFAFVSQWQRDSFIKRFWLMPQKSRAIRYGVAPPFLALALPPPWFVSGAPPVLVYTSTPYRGLDVLLDAFPSIHAAVPDVRLRVFSDMSLYQQSDSDFQDLYRRAKTMPGVEHVGAIGQAALANEIAGAAALAYPSTYAETAGIAVLEAMACGVTVLTTQLGALPETTAGFARLLPYTNDKASLAASFAAMTITALNDVRSAPTDTLRRREAQIAYIRQNHSWPACAREWVAWLSEFAQGPRL